LKNPEKKPLRIVDDPNQTQYQYHSDDTHLIVLSNLAIAQSNLILAKKDSGMPHFIAIIKELELRMGFTFEIMED